MPEKSSLESYLLSRDLVHPFDPEMQEDPVFGEGNNETLTKLATMWGQYYPEIRALIQRRLWQIRDELIYKARPEETTVLRQAMAEVDSILSDLQQIYNEADRRNAQKEEDQSDEQEEQGEQEQEEQESEPNKSQAPDDFDSIQEISSV